MKILFLGDIVGRCGIDAAFENVPDIKEKYGVDFCVANCENSAGGFGVTKAVLEDLQRAGIDAFTGGNHIFSQKEALSLFDDNSFDIARPYNLSPSSPGKGAVICTAENGVKIGIINVLGNLFINGVTENAFKAVDKAIEEIREKTNIIIIDFHAEATSEKKAMGYYLDGKVTAVFGTHTHIQTADEEIFPGGTAYITDTGMCGAKNSVLGAEITAAVAKFTEDGKVKYKAANGERIFSAVIIEVDESGKSVGIERIRI